MPLDGLRAWIGEVERKLGMRTRVFLVLATIAIGGAGAAIYLALDTRDNAVSESDVQELQDQLEAQAGGGAADGGGLTRLNAKLKALQAKVERLDDGGEASEQEGSDGGTSKGAGTASGGSGDGGDTASGPSLGGAEGVRAKLQELLEQAKEQNEKTE